MINSEIRYKNVDVSDAFKTMSTIPNKTFKHKVTISTLNIVDCVIHEYMFVYYNVRDTIKLNNVSIFDGKNIKKITIGNVEKLKLFNVSESCTIYLNGHKIDPNEHKTSDNDDLDVYSSDECASDDYYFNE